MKVLGINCAGRVTNVGFASDGTVLAESNKELGRKQSSELPLIVSEVLEKSKMMPSEIDLIALGVGPGYYTGIRTGIAYGAAFAESLDIPVVPLSSLEIFVWDLLGEYEYMMPLFRAKRLSCYAALYSRSGEKILPPSFISKDEILRTLKQYPEAVIVTPDAERYVWLGECGSRLIERTGASGGACALMGEHYSGNARLPREIRGEYLHAPDIGPCNE